MARCGTITLARVTQVLMDILNICILSPYKYMAPTAVGTLTLARVIQVLMDILNMNRIELKFNKSNFKNSNHATNADPRKSAHSQAQLHQCSSCRPLGQR